MYTLLRSVPIRQLFAMQAPAFLAAFVIAELFYKFHSFTLECLAFLATWFVIDFVVTTGVDYLAPKGAAGEKPQS
jgi:hypothetical protein